MRLAVTRLILLLAMLTPVQAAPVIFSGSNSNTNNTLDLITNVGLITIDTAFNAGASNNQGWWSPTSPHSGSNANTITGDRRGRDLFNSFFGFDLSNPVLAGVTNVSSITANLSGGNSNGPPALVNFTLFDVSTPFAMVRADGPPNPTIFNDLGSGNSYGNIMLATGIPTNFNLALNTQAVTDLNDAITNSASHFVLGGTLFPSAAAVPEIDAGSATIPLTLVLVMFLLVFDRRPRFSHPLRQN